MLFRCYFLSSSFKWSPWRPIIPEHTRSIFTKFFRRRSGTLLLNVPSFTVTVNSCRRFSPLGRTAATSRSTWCRVTGATLPAAASIRDAAATASVSAAAVRARWSACTARRGRRRPDEPGPDSRRCARPRRAWAAAAGDRRGTAARTARRRRGTAAGRCRQDAGDACARTRCCAERPTSRRQ